MITSTIPPLDVVLADEFEEQDILIYSLDEQVRMLSEKPCSCPMAQMFELIPK